MRGTQSHRLEPSDPGRFIPAHAGNTSVQIPARFPLSVHPRACGGTRSSTSRAHRTYRFIPAHAGNTSYRSSSRRCTPVHPRACGEHDDTGLRLLPVAGSSPRMRGTQWSSARRLALQRFIPAHAGNTATCRQPWHGSTVHPRACGEHENSPLASTWPLGSSPRMRGTHLRFGST